MASDPIVLRSIMQKREAVRPIAGSTDLPMSMAERLYGLEQVPIMPYEPDPRTHNGDYYYNSKLNKLFVKIKTSPVPVWRPFGG